MFLIRLRLLAIFLLIVDINTRATYVDNNGKYNLPAIQGIYTLFNAQTGVPIAQMDAKTLTTLRTAAASALAADFLSRKDSETLLMVGTGALAPKLIQAHCTIRPIKKVMIWGRNFEKAKQLLSFEMKQKKQDSISYRFLICKNGQKGS